MNHVAVLQVEQCLDNLRDDVASFVLGETLLSPQLLVQIAVLAALKHNIDVLGVVEIPVQLHDVRVVESPLNFEFALHLGEKVEFLEHVLEDHL